MSAARYYRLVKRCLVPFLSGEVRFDTAEYQLTFMLLSVVNNPGVLLSIYPSINVYGTRQADPRVTFEELFHFMTIIKRMIVSKERSLSKTTSWWDGTVKNFTGCTSLRTSSSGSKVLYNWEHK
jgi:hypothetical protein